MTEIEKFRADLDRIQELLEIPLDAVHLTPSAARKLEAEAGEVPTHIGDTRIVIPEMEDGGFAEGMFGTVIVEPALERGIIPEIQLEQKLERRGGAEETPGDNSLMDQQF